MMEQLNEKLEGDEEFRKTLIMVLFKLKEGGDLPAITIIVMRSLLANKLMSKFSLTGQRGKIAFKGTRTCKVILTNSYVILSSEVRINDNITAEAYSNGTMLNCSFNIRNGDSFGSIVLAAENLTTGKFQDIAGSFGDENPLVTSFGINVFGNETTALIVENSENSLLVTFNHVMCKHERQYKCYLGVRQIGSFTPKRIESDIMSIHVKVPPSQPDNISLVSMQMTSAPVIYDGDNVTYVCLGNVGQPPKSFNFQMNQRKHILSRNYTSTETSTQELQKTCSYYRISYTSLHVTAEDNQAIIRCVVSNSVNVDMYADSEPLEVYYAVRMPTINKHPNKTDYVVGSDASINLTCTTVGNPKPSYVWYKESMIQAIGTGENFIIKNLNKTHGGVYTCSVSNTFKEVIHTERVQVQLHIVDNAPVVKDAANSRSTDMATALTVNINENKTGIVGNDKLQMHCSFTKENVYTIFGIGLFGKSVKQLDFESLVSFLPGREARITRTGDYLRDRVMLTNLTQESTEIKITFTRLECIDEKEYRCKVTYQQIIPDESDDEWSSTTSIKLKVLPSKPEMFFTAHSLSNDTNRIDNETDSMTKEKKRSTQLISNKDINETAFMEGDNITFTCTGNVGNPEGIFVWQKIYSSEQISNYSHVSTESIPESCSYNGTSNLTIQMTADDNKAKIRCIVQSETSGVSVYADSEPLQIYLEDQSTINISPNITENEHSNGIMLKCSFNISAGASFHSIALAAQNKTTGEFKDVVGSYSDGNPTSTAFGFFLFGNVTAVLQPNNALMLTFNKLTWRHERLYKCILIVRPPYDRLNTERIESGIMQITVTADDSKTPSSSGGSQNVLERRVKLKNKSKCYVGFPQKSVAESRTESNYEYIDLEDDATKRLTVNNEIEIDDIREHNKKYLKKQMEEEESRIESKTSPQPAVYAQVNEAAKSRNKQNTETLKCIDKQEDCTYAETLEGIYDKAGDRRHKQNENDEHFDTSNSSNKQNSNHYGDTEWSIQTSHIESYNNQAFVKEENRKVATVSLTIRSSACSDDDDKTNQSGYNKSKKGYEDVKGTDQTGTSEEDTSH
ncbi:unnamed protein product [Mytilus coruscus]|uniref:Ig-like domain-containing protein n=1 Tax=Mytilus coruscus TaxID=42192 RepID=A0A6J8ERR1_MYTCO|nr:unnamed protein product [Mytilus coruscus]